MRGRDTMDIYEDVTQRRRYENAIGRGVEFTGVWGKMDKVF